MSECDPFFFLERGGRGRAGKMSGKKSQRGGERSERGIGDGGFRPRAASSLFTQAAAFHCRWRKHRFIPRNTLSWIFSPSSQSCSHSCSPLRKFLYLSPLYFFLTSVSCWGGVAFPRRVRVCLSHNIICMCKCVFRWGYVCVLYHLQVNLQITGHVFSFLSYIGVSLSACVCMWVFACFVLCMVCICVCVFSLGNRQVPLQSQTAGCFPQSLTPWYPAEGDAPPVVCWSPALSYQSLYDTVERHGDGHVSYAFPVTHGALKRIQPK